MTEDKKQPRIVIAGAGSIGCFVGGLLQASGHRVDFLGRERTATLINAHGFQLTDYAGMSIQLKCWRHQYIG